MLVPSLLQFLLNMDKCINHFHSIEKVSPYSLEAWIRCKIIRQIFTSSIHLGGRENELQTFYNVIVQYVLLRKSHENKTRRINLPLRSQKKPFRTAITYYQYELVWLIRYIATLEIQMLQEICM
jgi:hypothetical protein